MTIFPNITLGTWGTEGPSGHNKILHGVIWIKCPRKYWLYCAIKKLWLEFEANPGCSSTTCTCSHSLFISKNTTIHSAYYWLPHVAVASSVAGLNGKAARNTSVFTNFDMNVLGNFLSSQRKTEHQLGLANSTLPFSQILSGYYHQLDVSIEWMRRKKRKNLEVDWSSQPITLVAISKEDPAQCFPMRRDPTLAPFASRVEWNYCRSQFGRYVIFGWNGCNP